MYILSSTQHYRLRKHINEWFRLRTTCPTRRGKTLSLTRKLLQNADVVKGNYTIIIINKQAHSSFWPLPKNTN